MIQAMVSQCWYTDLGREGAPLEPVGDPVYVEAPVVVERVIAVGELDKDQPENQMMLLQLNPTGKPNGQRLFLWQPKRWLKIGA